MRTLGLCLVAGAAVAASAAAPPAPVKRKLRSKRDALQLVAGAESEPSFVKGHVHASAVGEPTWHTAQDILQHGAHCMPHSSMDQCGLSLVCRDGSCGQCVRHKECPAKFSCMSAGSVNGVSQKLCVERDMFLHWTWGDTVATVLITMTAILSAAAGLGGGGIYVPLFLLLLGMTAREAVPLSQALIIGGSFVNIVMFAGERHPKFPDRPKIDYEVVMMLQPALAAGVTLGVMAHVVSPQWLIIATLTVTLIISCYKTGTKGSAMWKKETVAMAAIEESASTSSSSSSSSGDSGSMPSGASRGRASAPHVDNPAQILQRKFRELKTFDIIVAQNTHPMFLIVACWLSALGMSFVKFEPCSPLFWAQVGATVMMAFAFTEAGKRAVLPEGVEETEKTEGLLNWNSTTVVLYPVLASVAGFLGGFLGIGGGIVLAPLLLELGMVPEANQATTALFVFLSSSLATVQFALLGAEMPQYMAWYCSFVLVATFAGQTVIEYFIKKTGRSSIIVLSIAAVIAFSLMMMVWLGTKDVMGDLHHGAPMGFAPHNLCGSM